MRSPFRHLIARYASEVYPALRGKEFHSIFTRLKQLEYGGEVELRRWQQERLRDSLQLWTTQIPFYREHLQQRAKELKRSREDLIEEMVASLQLDHLPLMNKASIRAAGDRMHVESYQGKGLRRNHTGGSTGEVFHFMQDATDDRWLYAGTRLFRSYLGLSMGSRMFQIWGSPIGLTKAKTLRARFGRWLYHSQLHSTYDLTLERRKAIVHAMVKDNPELIIGYPSSLSAFLPELEALPAGSFPALKGIWTASETLLPSQREDLERVFGTPVFNNYGCREFGPLAMECQQHEGLHLNEGTYLFEFLPVAEDLHEIVVTDLKNRCMPLVRYRIGDLAQGLPKRCSCGRSFSILRGVEGRRFDLIRGPRGEAITGTFWTLLLRSRPGVQRFQVVQEDWLRFTIRLEVEDCFNKDALTAWEARIQEQFRDPVQIDWQVGAKIEQLASGKFRFIQSRVAERAESKKS